MLAVDRRIGVGEVRVSNQAIANVIDVLNTNRLSYGPYSKKFERDWARIHNQRFAVFVNSGTSALQIGLGAMKEFYGWPDGAKVIVPAVTFVASLNVILQNRLTPVLVDVRPEDFLIGLDGWPEDAVAVMPVALYGNVIKSPVYYKAKDIKAKVITDACESGFIGGVAGGDITCFSTYACHLINTGVGGLATTNDPVLAGLMRSLANHGRDGIYYSIDQELGKVEVIEARFRFERPGYSYRATELEAAIGCAALETWLDNINARQTTVRWLRKALSDLPLRFPDVPTTECGWMFLPMVCETQDVRDRLIQFIESRGIETRMFLPLTNQPYMKSIFGADVEDRYPVARELNRRAFYVGSHQYLSPEDVAYMDAVFHEFFSNN